MTPGLKPLRLPHTPHLTRTDMHDADAGEITFGILVPQILSAASRIQPAFHQRLATVSSARQLLFPFLFAV